MLLAVSFFVLLTPQIMVTGFNIAGTKDAATPVPANVALANLPPLPAPEAVVALRDGMIVLARSVVVEGNTLRYTTPFGGMTTVPLEKVDIERTRKLSADRGVKFDVP